MCDCSERSARPGAATQGRATGGGSVYQKDYLWGRLRRLEIEHPLGSEFYANLLDSWLINEAFTLAPRGDKPDIISLPKPGAD
jgi:hypothetical protein